MKLKFVAISDTHCRHRSLRLPEADVLIHAGDITFRGRKEEVLDFLHWFEKQPHSHKIFIAGNHDFYFQENSDEIIQKIIPKNVVYLNDEAHNINGLKIWGSPVTPWFYNWAFNRKRGAEISAHWAKIPDDTDILITHGPPYGILDEVVNEKNVGCRDLKNRIDAIHPKTVVFGHVHESYGKLTRAGTLFINACVVNESYELVNKPVMFEVDTTPADPKPEHSLQE